MKRKNQPGFRIGTDSMGRKTWVRDNTPMRSISQVSNAEYSGTDNTVSSSIWEWYENQETRDSLSGISYHGGDIEDDFWESEQALSLVESHGKDTTVDQWERAYIEFQSENGWMGDPDEIKNVYPPSPYFLDGDSEAARLFSVDYENLCKRYGKPMKARTRWVFFDTENNRVLKLVGTNSGLIDSANEVGESKREDSIMCNTQWAEDMGWGQSGLILESEMVTPINSDDPRFPEWANSIDCGQVGITEDGEVKAYDM